LIFVTGVPGSGKSYFIRHSPDLRELPRVDIKDIYLKYPEACQFDGWKLAQGEIFSDLLRKHEREQPFFTQEQWKEIKEIANVKIEELVTAIFNSRMPPYLRDRRN
jgi:dephospho-CoA kinase